MILEIIIMTLIVWTLFNILLNKFHMPTIIGYILTGTIISYLFWFYHLEDNTELKHIWEFWIVFLMFTIWLEFSVNDLVKMKKNVFLLWGLQFFWISTIFFLTCIFLFKLDSIESLIISLWLALSSTAIVLKIMKENWDISRNYWNRVLWILLFQDLMVIPILLLITILTISDLNIYLLITKTILAAIVLFLLMWFFWKYLLDQFLYNVAKTKSNEIFIWFVLLIIIASSFVSDYLWFSYTLWAFIAWILLAETQYKHRIESDIIAFRDLFLWLFFITVWFQLDFSIIYENIWTIFILFVWFLFLKILVLYILLRFTLNRWSSLKTSLALFQFWEFWIVIFEIASWNGLLSWTLSHILVVVIILSMIITPLILKNIYQITDFLLWVRHLEDSDISKKQNDLHDHIIIIWYSRLWKLIQKMLTKNNNSNYLIVENDIRVYKKALKNWLPVIYWDAHKVDILEYMNIEKAKAVIITIWEKDGLFLVSWVISKLNINWKIIVRASDYREEKKLRHLWITDIVLELEKTANSMLKRIG